MAAPDYVAAHGIETAPVPIAYEHEGLQRDDRVDAVEYLPTVVATRTMDRTDWVRTRVAAWIVDAYHFDRLLQIVAAALRAAFGLRYREVYEALAAAEPGRYPVLAGVRSWATDRARRIQAGEAELAPSERWLGIWWPVDQYIVVRLVAERRLDAFYAEAESLLADVLAARGIADEDGILGDAVALNRVLYRRPRVFENIELPTRSAVLEFAQAELAGRPIPLDRRPYRYRIDRGSTVWADTASWCEDVVAQYYRRADFLYPVARIDAWGDRQAATGASEAAECGAA
jgi:hypothetical protein